ncbi:YgiQ family radical SAM protein [bacterium]|nr:YgiQ family radical SAM protein [bacterium]
MFDIPASSKEMKALGWEQLDIIIVSGDAFVDHYSFGTALIARLLRSKGYRVGVIPQPDPLSNTIAELGEPKLFWGVTSGVVDSMVSNYTALLKKRRSDDFTPGGKNSKRPDRAVIAYTQAIKRLFKGSQVPIILGGIEASLRRVAHYDFWSDSVRRSILFDAKADYLVYGMAEKSIVEIAKLLVKKESITAVRGICYLSSEPRDDAITIDSFETVKDDKQLYGNAFKQWYFEQDSVSGNPVQQQHGNRWLIHNAPSPPLAIEDMDRIHSLPFTRNAHPIHANQGEIRALQTIQFSITTHRGCYGECTFCAIALHQGRLVQWRSHKNVVKEAKKMVKHPQFRGVITDVGGPSLNMYGFECDKKKKSGACKDKRCIYPEVCSLLNVSHKPQQTLLEEIRKIPEVKHLFVASGMRYDMVLYDKKHGLPYLQNLVQHHISGQMKIAPEHVDSAVLDAMGKPPVEILEQFRKLYKRVNNEKGKRQFLTYYLIAAHPGSTDQSMKNLKHYISKNIGVVPEQIQVFTPTPLTVATTMYWTGWDPFTGEEIFIERSLKGKRRQKELVQGRIKSHKK